MASCAVADTVTEPEIVLPSSGDVIDADGAVASRVTSSVAVATLFAASRAVTVTVFAPGCSAIPAADQLVVPLAVPDPPAAFVQLTCVTPTLSLALPLTVSVLAFVRYVPLPVGLVIATVGDVTSGAVYVTVSVAVFTLFAASFAVTVTTFVPGCSATVLTDQLVVPLAVPDPPRSFAHVTCVTPTLSLAVPLTAIGLALVV
jgi:hypothetical protein